MVLRLLIPFLSLIPLGILAGVVRAWTALQAPRDFRSSAQTRRSLRLPGESAREKIEELDGQITHCLGFAFALLPLLLLAYLVSARNFAGSDPSLWVSWAVFAFAAFIWLAVRLILLTKQRQNWRLGLSGETLVGEELNRLLKADCQIFHDLPLADNWNIDHVVVAPSGVYAVETKCRRKQEKGTRTQRCYEVIYDGHGLQFPHYYNTAMITQAQFQASRLSQLLTEALDTNISVTPILALPGWLIRRETPEGMAVMNPNQELGDFILSRPRSRLSPDALSTIAAHLDQRCRDVEFR
jgi:Nuclease-related domain